ncbi:hypothetical protein DFH09DRAFT_1315242 [Mycena vulgaris]|nr:hypothetical protein DFH09DRAFT_1315242 [Mycena vulgaris]
MDCLRLLGISLMYWDHLITLDDEIRFLWKRARSASAYWFFAIRYTAFAGNIPVTFFIFYSLAPRWSAHFGDAFLFCSRTICRCHAYHIGHQVLLVGTQLTVCIVMLLRIYALYGRNVRFLAWFLALSTPFLAVIVWVMIGISKPSLGVMLASPQRLPTLQIDLSAAWAGLFLYDSIIFGLTVGKTYATWRRAGSQEYMPIHNLIFRDGALYFAAMAMSNLLNIVTYYVSGKMLLQPILAGSLSTFASCLSVTMMSRLMLNLHKKTHVGVLTHLSFDDGVVLGVGEPHVR